MRRERVSERIAVLRRSLDVAQRDLRILDTLRLSSELEKAQRAEADTQNSRLVRAKKSSDAPERQKQRLKLCMTQLGGRRGKISTGV